MRMDLTQEILKGNPRAIAKGISMVENNSTEAQELLKEIFPHTGRSAIIGITGSPGSGKSTLVDKLIEGLRKNEKKIGIVAVDPSSPFTGGAILGDRIRMMRHSIDSGIYIRSMATRGHLGGLAKASGEAIAILEASGKDIILVETVGVGQDEVEVVKFADVVLVVLMPGAGDEIQVFKAGIMEIADIFVLNKADSPETDKTERQLRAILDLGLKESSIPPVVKTIATEGKGIEALLEEINKVTMGRDQESKASRKKSLISWLLRDIISEKLFRAVSESIQGSEIENFIEKIYRREIDPYTVAEKIIRKMKEN
ncbi:MAG: methylmalonyl Co-A mutase-associated GTPase MeaB [Candidatus Aminicenantes bacterium]|nr:methylmalonyl Co-A mutase-associated GTPase MeaB [Candidatus Aminicenantes bacterium]MDH5383098.1 methylmalonyl Co-A mutase-associated GTPase MeaB [Candidatus Aminicenantes bacterium]MDH5744868.1 methylmalonyl Co-A mutase-associated GTPase MeaB [Candidatus Aminicenantes bacterium]